MNAMPIDVKSSTLPPCLATGLKMPAPMITPSIPIGALDMEEVALAMAGRADEAHIAART